MFCRCYFLSSPFLRSPLRPIISEHIGPIFYQNFRIGTHMGGNDQPDLSRSLKGCCYGNRFLARIGENWHSHLHSVRWHSTTDGRIVRCMSALRPPTISLCFVLKFGELWPITPEFCSKATKQGKLQPPTSRKPLIQSVYTDKSVRTCANLLRSSDVRAIYTLGFATHF